MVSETKSYREVAFGGAWSGRVRGMWAIATLGLVAGAAVGLAAPFFPVLVGAQTLGAAASLIPASAAIFGSVGMSLGFGTGAIVGVTSGASAAVAEEQERRLKAAGIDLQASSPEQPKEKTRLQKMKDGLSTYINLKVGAVFTAVAAIGGLVMAAAFISLGGLSGAGAASSAAMPALNTLLGAAATNATAVTAYFTGVMASMGALWCFNFPKISNAMTMFCGDVLSGKKLNTQWGPKPEMAPTAPQIPHASPELAQPSSLAHPADRKFQSYQELVAQSKAETGISAKF